VVLGRIEQEAARELLVPRAALNIVGELGRYSSVENMR
jgi:hypothetical protein